MIGRKKEIEILVSGEEIDANTLVAAKNLFNLETFLTDIFDGSLHFDFFTF